MYTKQVEVPMQDERVIYVQRRLVLTPRTCAMCGKEFEGFGRARFCSKPCQRHWDYRQHVKSRREKRRARSRRQQSKEQGGE